MDSFPAEPGPPIEIGADRGSIATPDDLVVTLAWSDGGSCPAPLPARLIALRESGEHQGRPGELTVLHEWNDETPQRTVVAGLGSPTADAVRVVAAGVAAFAARVGVQSIRWPFRPAELGLAPRILARAIVDGTAAGLHDLPSSAGAPAITLCGDDAVSELDAARDAALVAAWVAWCRRLVDGPPNVVDPPALAGAVRAMAARFASLRADVLSHDDLAAEGFAALCEIGRGAGGASLLVLRHEPAGAPAEPVLGLVGKTVTYDAGGLCLKPPSALRTEKSDMAGGAAVLAATGAIAELALPVRVVAVLPAFENVPDGDAARPGSVVRSHCGVTVEITDTDAEGRVALADALTYTGALGATHLIDVAALTGAVIDALGDRRSALFGDDETLLAAIEQASANSGDAVWRMPHDPLDRDYLASPVADLANVAPTRHAGAIQGAVFLSAFTAGLPWAHLDIAGAGYLLRDRGDEFGGPGATGHGVRLLVELARAAALSLTPPTTETSR
jgi:leucyl aminopeptidase